MITPWPCETVQLSTNTMAWTPSDPLAINQQSQHHGMGQPIVNPGSTPPSQHVLGKSPIAQICASTEGATQVKAGKPNGRVGQRKRQTGKTDAVPYAAIVQRLRTMEGKPTKSTLLSLFLRDELRSLLKRNGISYHKPGRANLMKSKVRTVVVRPAPSG